MNKEERKAKNAKGEFEKAIEKLFGVVGLIQGQESEDDLKLNISERNGVANIIRDCAYDICEAVDLLTGKAEVST